MRALVSYSRPRGIYGKYIFTVVMYYIHETEQVEIAVTRGQTKYSCDYCGRWARIDTYTVISPTEHRSAGAIELFRYDNVEPGDTMRLQLKDPSLIFYQDNQISPQMNRVILNEYTRAFSSQHNTILPKGKIYETVLIDWDNYTQETLAKRQGMKVEEELIQQTMNAEKITIDKLLVNPTDQSGIFQVELKYLM